MPSKSYWPLSKLELLSVSACFTAPISKDWHVSRVKKGSVVKLFMIPLNTLGVEKAKVMGDKIAGYIQ